MRPLALTCLLAFALGTQLRAEDVSKKLLYEDLVVPVLAAKCASCHGEDRQRGRLRVDTLEAIFEGGNEGPSVVPGEVDGSPLLERIYLPLDDEDRMPPEDKEQLTAEETALLAFWVSSGAKEKVAVADLKPDEEAAKAIAHVAGNLPEIPVEVAKADAPKMDPETEKLITETIGRVEETGATLMAIAQDTPELRFSALNVSREYSDENLALLAPVAEQVKWMDLARTQVTDKGLAHLSGMTNLTRLHLENTEISDKGLESIAGLESLEYLNLYGTKVTDEGVAKLAGLKNLQKLFLWQSEATVDGAKKIAAAIPGLDVNIGWDADVTEPVLLAANTPADAKPEPKPAPAEPSEEEKKKAEAAKKAAEEKKKAEAAKKAAEEKKKAEAAKKAEEEKKKAEAAKKAEEEKKKAENAAKPTFESALAELDAVAAMSEQDAAKAKSDHEAAVKAAAEAEKKAQAAKAKADQAAKVAAETKAALDQLKKAVAARNGG